METWHFVRGCLWSSLSRRWENGASSPRQQKNGTSRKNFSEFMILCSKVSPRPGRIFTLVLDPSSLLLLALDVRVKMEKAYDYAGKLILKYSICALKGGHTFSTLKGFPLVPLLSPRVLRLQGNSFLGGGVTTPINFRILSSFIC